MNTRSRLTFFKEQWQLMRSMPPKQRLEHFWEYYRFYLIGLLALLLLIFFAVQGQIRNRQEVLVSGIFINTDTSDAGYRFLSEDYWTACGSNRNQRVDLIETIIIDFSDTADSQNSGNLILQIDTLIAARELDYMILDETAFRFYSGRGVCGDLSGILEPSHPEPLKNQLVYTQDPENAESICSGLKLTGSGFEARFGLTAEPVYLVILSNAPHMEHLPDFIQYLLTA